MPNIMVNGVELCYELHGSGDEVLVLNNGVIASPATWVPFQVPAFAPHDRVLLYDMRGQGQSQPWAEGDPDYTWEAHADDLAAWLDTLVLETAHVGGIRMGASWRGSSRCATRNAAASSSSPIPSAM